MRIQSNSVIVISGPSGAGKGVLIKGLLDTFSCLQLVVSVTTRSPRQGEVAGKDYIFWSREMFMSHIHANDFVEWFKVHDHYYGTLKSSFHAIHDSGKTVLLEIDTQGALNVKKQYPNAFLIFIAAPDLKVLKKRLVDRGTETDIQIERRLKTASEELKKTKHYDYVLINDILARSRATLNTLFQERLDR